jgi:hypothetical protein
MHTTTWLQDKAEAIARRGRDVRSEISSLVAAAASDAHRIADGFVGLSRSVVAGAAKGVERVLPGEREATLRAVVDGLADGLGITAQAASLALQEAAGAASRWARQDIEKLAADLRAVTDRFADTVAAGVVRGARGVWVGASDLADHAGIALRRALPSLEAALAAASADPIGLGQQALAAGTAATKGAAGALFTALGNHLQRLGAKLQPDEPPTPPPG